MTLNLAPAGRTVSAATQAISAPPSAPLKLNGTVVVSPATIGDTVNYPIGTNLPVFIKLVNASSINNFKVAIMTWPTVLNPVSVTSGDVFSGGAVLPVTNCVNGLGLGCAVGGRGQDGAGVVTFAQVLLGGETNPGTSTLFQVNYQVTGVGATRIHILLSTLAAGAQGTPSFSLSVVTGLDGSFSNKNCGVALCKVPVVSFSVPRNSTLVQQRRVFFNASASVTLNPSASIVNYDWIFGNGDTTGASTNSTSYTYDNAGNFVVILRVQDTANAYGIWSYNLRISRFFIDLAINPGDLTIDQTTFVLPGTLVTIGVTVTNLSSKAVNASVSVFLSQGSRGNLTLNHQTFTKLDVGVRGHLVATWDTTTYAPKVYEVIGHVDPVRNGTMIVQNDTSTIDAIGFVQLVDPVPVGLSLSLVSGISLGALLAVSVGVSLIRKVLSRKPELGPELP